MAILMEKYLEIMEDIGEFAALNFFGTIQHITNKFPEEMQREWVRWAFSVLEDTGQQTKSKDLVEFVRHETDKANSLYERFFLVLKPPNSRPAVKKSAALALWFLGKKSSERNRKLRLSCPSAKAVTPWCKRLQATRRYKRIRVFA